MYYIRNLALVITLLLLIIPTYAQDTTNEEIIEEVLRVSEVSFPLDVFSPDEAYSAHLMVSGCVDVNGTPYAYQEIHLDDGINEDPIVLVTQLIACGGVGSYGLAPLRFSENGDFLYYTDESTGQPDGLALAWSYAIYRHDIATEETTRLGRAQFSPNGDVLLSWSNTALTLSDVETGEDTTHDMLSSDLYLTSVQWLPDSSSVLYIQANEPFASTRSVVTLLDIATGEQTILVDTAQ